MYTGFTKTQSHISNGCMGLCFLEGDSEHDKSYIYFLKQMRGRTTCGARFLQKLHRTKKKSLLVLGESK